jgi:hypothetical protein
VGDVDQFGTSGCRTPVLVSIAAEPVPLTTKVCSLSVRKTYRSSSWRSSITET